MMITKKDLVARLEASYKDDDVLYAVIYDKDSIEYYVDDYCLDEKRAAELWEEVATEMDDDGYIPEAGAQSISEAVSSRITEEEEDHANCIPVIDEAGATIHQRLTTLADADEKA